MTSSASPRQPERRVARTRFVCISDTHNCTVKLPKGDVLIHAGDLTNQGSHSELSRAVKWLEKADFETKIVIAGNHDITLDEQFYSQYGLYFHNQSPQSPDDCLSLLISSPTITYLSHSSRIIQLRDPAGPKTIFKVFGSPYSPRQGQWAFQYEHSTTSNEANDLWAAIPHDADVVVTHTPARTHRDEDAATRQALGCEALRQALWRVRPRLHVCGHVHHGRGVERVRWDIEGRAGLNVAFAEVCTQQLDDPGADQGTQKLSLADLSSRALKRGGKVLDNDGSHPQLASWDQNQHQPMVTDTHGKHASPGQFSDRAHPRTQSDGAGQQVTVGMGTRGLGGDPESPRCDQEALQGRMGRRETCVVNCAVMASNYPHVGGKKLNKPVVIDLDLPVWE